MISVFDVSREVFIENIERLILIYNDSQEVRVKRKENLENKFENNEDIDFALYRHYNSSFNSLLLQSLFVSAFAYLENYMMVTARLLEKEMSPQRSIDKLKTRGYLNKYRSFLYTNCKINEANSQSVLWTEINDYREIRNCMVHHFGYISEEKKDLKEIAIKYDVFIEHLSLIKLKDEQLLKRFSNTTSSWVDRIYVAIKKKYDN